MQLRGRLHILTPCTFALQFCAAILFARTSRPHLENPWRFSLHLTFVPFTTKEKKKRRKKMLLFWLVSSPSRRKDLYVMTLVFNIWAMPILQAYKPVMNDPDLATTTEECNSMLFLNQGTMVQGMTFSHITFQIDFKKMTQQSLRYENITRVFEQLSGRSGHKTPTKIPAYIQSRLIYMDESIRRKIEEIQYDITDIVDSFRTSAFENEKGGNKTISFFHKMFNITSTPTPPTDKTNKNNIRGHPKAVKGHIITPFKPADSQEKEKDEKHPRNKRQLIMAALVGLMGGLIGSLFGNFATEKLLDILNQKTNVIQARVESNMVDIYQNKKDIQRIKTTLESIQEQFERFVMYNRAFDLQSFGLFILEMIDTEYQRTKATADALRKLLMGKFQPGLIDTKVLRMALTKIKEQATLEELTPVVRTVSDMYQMPVSFLYNETASVLHVFIHIPLFKENQVLDLYRFIPVPIKSKRAANVMKVFYEVQPGKQFFAHNRDHTLYREMNQAELAECPKIGSVYFCIDFAMQKRARKTCLSTLFLSGTTNDIKSYCDFVLKKHVSFFERINSTTYVISESEPMMATAECEGNDKISKTTFEGTHLIKTIPGCRLNTPYFVIDRPADLDSVEVKVTMNSLQVDPDEVVGPLDDFDLDIIKAKLSTIGASISVSEVKGLQTFRARLAVLNAQYGFWHAVRVHWLEIVLSFAAIVFAACLIYILCKCYRKRKDKRGNLNVNVSLPPAPLQQPAAVIQAQAAPIDQQPSQEQPRRSRFARFFRRSTSAPPPTTARPQSIEMQDRSPTRTAPPPPDCSYYQNYPDEKLPPKLPPKQTPRPTPLATSTTGATASGSDIARLSTLPSASSEASSMATMPPPMPGIGFLAEARDPQLNP